MTDVNQAQRLDVLLHLSLQGSGDHAACPLPGQLVQRLCDFRSLSLCSICSNLVHGVSFLRLLPQLLGLTHPKDTPLLLLRQSTTSDYTSEGHGMTTKEIVFLGLGPIASPLTFMTGRPT